MNNIKTLFLSDLHLGSIKCNADAVLRVLHDNVPEELYLVGDIVDVWALKRKFYFPDSHWRVIQKIIRLAHKGTKVYYICGNHDSIIRKTILPMSNMASPIKFTDYAEWRSIAGGKYLVIHGDQFDRIVSNYKWVAILGDIGYSLLLRLNRVYPFKGSLSRIAKNAAKSVFYDRFYRSITQYAYSLGYDGVVCGHIHQPSLSFQYINCGDFVDSCSYIVETLDGKIELRYSK